MTVSPSTLTVTEGSTGTYTVVLNTQPTGDVTVTVGGATGDVTADTDTGTDGAQTTLTFTSSTWDTAQTVTVTAAEDDDATADAKVTLTHTVAGADYASESAKSVEVTITENDARGVTVSPGTSLTVSEGSTETYTVVLNTQPTGDVTVTVGGATGDVTADTDTGTDGAQTTLTFTSSTWDTAQTVTVTAAEDDDATADAKVTLTHTVAGADYASESAKSVEVTITENDARGVTVSPGTSLTVEEGSTETYTVVLNTQPTGDVTVTVGGATGDVTADTDTGTDGAQTTLTFTSSTWDTAQTVTVTAAEDDDATADAKVTLTHAVAGADYASESAKSVEVTITENDARGVTVSPGTSLTVEEGSTGTYTVVLNTQPTGDVTVTVGGATGDVTADTDTGTDGAQTTLTFTSSTWDTAQTVTVTAAEDDDATADAKVTLTHTVAGADYASESAKSVEVTITENDARGVTVSPGTSLTVEEGSTGTYTVVLNTQPTGDVTVTVGGATGDVTADTDTGTDGAQTTLTFTSSTWDTAQTVTVTAAEDDDATADAKVTLTHTVAGADYASESAKSVEVTITENDARGVTVSPGTSLTVSEGSTETYTVVLNTQPTGDVTVTVGGATGDVTADTDTGTDGAQTTLTFTSSTWDTAQTVTVTAAEDDDATADAKVTLTHTVAGADYASESAKSVEVTITENDARGVTVSPGTSLTVEEGSTETYTVVLNTQPTGDVTVTVGGATGDVTADTDTGTDGAQTTLTFTSSTWDTAQTVTVTAAEDDDATADAKVTLTHTVAGADYASESAKSVEVTITENDTRGVTVSRETLTVSEGSTETYTVVLNTQPTGDVTVTVGGATGDVTADTDTGTDGAQTTLTFTSSTWDTAQTVTVTAAEDDDATADAKVTLTHTVAGADYASESAKSVEVTITENDARGVTVSPGTSLTVEEGSRRGPTRWC